MVLEIHTGASVNASTVLADWKSRHLVEPVCASTSPLSTGTEVLGGLFYASLATNFTIRGPGATNGAAKAWNSYMNTTGATGDGQPNPDGLVRSNMFVFSQCTDVVVEDLVIEDSSAWTLNPRFSQRLRFRRLSITAPSLQTHGHNTVRFPADAPCRSHSHHCAIIAHTVYSGGGGGGAWLLAVVRTVLTHTHASMPSLSTRTTPVVMIASQSSRDLTPTPRRHGHAGSNTPLSTLASTTLRATALTG